MEYTEMGTGLLIVAIILELTFYIGVFMFSRTFYKKVKDKKLQNTEI
tara:strand:- start:669 stop:809 length:141 start_codon:yes stop_codon:yes gene_type:complete